MDHFGSGTKSGFTATIIAAAMQAAVPFGRCFARIAIGDRPRALGHGYSRMQCRYAEAHIWKMASRPGCDAPLDAASCTTNWIGRDVPRVLLRTAGAQFPKNYKYRPEALDGAITEKI